MSLGSILHREVQLNDAIRHQRMKNTAFKSLLTAWISKDSNCRQIIISD